MAKSIRSLASKKRKSVPGVSPFHQKRAAAAANRGLSKLRRSEKVVLAGTVRKALKGKHVTGRARRKLVENLRNK